jgi:hypothetical protein
LAAILLACGLALSAGLALAGDVVFREDFATLDRWRPFAFPKIPAHTTYEIRTEGDVSYLSAFSNASASAVVLKEDFNVYDAPLLRWRWRVSNVFKKGDARLKSGDDYPLRIYVMFRYTPEGAPLGKRLKYGAARLLFGEYPPHSSLNYIWANRPQTERIITNAYASEARMVLLQTGPERAGEWVEESVDLLEDYREAFGEDPPAMATLAVMSDSDQTGESARGDLDWIYASGAGTPEDLSMGISSP